MLKRFETQYIIDKMLSGVNNKHFCSVYTEKQLHINVINFAKNHNSPSDLDLCNFDGLVCTIFSLCRMKTIFSRTLGQSISVPNADYAVRLEGLHLSCSTQLTHEVIVIESTNKILRSLSSLFLAT